MKKVLIAALGAAIVFASSCKKESMDSLGSGHKELVVSEIVDTLKGDITVNTTVTRTTFLKGIVYVRPGVTLTVNAGVTIKASPGSTYSGDLGILIVEKGGKLIANGTASAPIVWTSNRPAGQRGYGDWGGIVILGNAPIITSTLATSNIKPIIGSINGRTTYGGDVANDNSGSITYNRIEFAGGGASSATNENREVNGLTLCGVGSGTTLHHVEVLHSREDGFAFFGGRVNATHLISVANSGDDYDFDEAYVGNLQFIIAYRINRNVLTGSNILEVTNNFSYPIGSQVGAWRTRPFIANATFIGPYTLSEAWPYQGSFLSCIQVCRDANLRLVNSIVSSSASRRTFVTTATTTAQFIGTDPTQPNTSIALNNLFEPGTASQGTKLADELGSTLFESFNAALQAEFIADGNSYLANYAAFKLNDYLEPQAGSPALSGGFNLEPYGFVGTTERGAVRTTDVWTAAPWISIAGN